MNPNRRPIFLLLSSAVAVLVMLILSLIAAGASSYGRREAQGRTDAAAMTLAGATGDYFTAYTRAFDFLSATAAVSGRDADACYELFSRIGRDYPELENIAAVDERGLFFGSAQAFDREHPPSIANLGFFKRTAAGERMVVMEPHLGPISGRRVTGVVLRLEDGDGRFRGLIGSSIRLDSLIAVWRGAAEAFDVSLVVESMGEALYAAGPYAEAAGTKLLPFNGRYREVSLAPFPGYARIVAVPKLRLRAYLAESPQLPVTVITLLLASGALLVFGRREERWSGRLAASEAKYRTYIDASPVGVFVVPPDGGFLESNSAMAALTGYPEDALTAHTLPSLAAPGQEQAVADLLGKLGPAETVRGEFEFIKPDSSRYAMELAVTRLGPKVFLGFALDATERRSSELALRKSLREKTKLIQEVHHRVRNTLGILYAILEFEQQRTDGIPADRLRSLQLKITAISLIHTSLYDSDRLESLRPAEYLDRLFSELFRILGGDRDIRWSLDADDSEIHIDQIVPLGLIAAELFSNSLLHAFPAGRGGRIRSSVRTVAGGALRFELRDDGLGLGPLGAEQPPEGSGLFIVRTLCEQLGAELVLTDEGGFGAALEFKPKESGRFPA